MSQIESLSVLKARPEGVTPEKLREIAASVQRVAILRTVWYPEVMNTMERTARDYLTSMGVPEDSIDVMVVPGSFELPLGLFMMAEPSAKKPPLDFGVALGCIVRGETPHFDFVASAASQGLMKAQLDLKMPVGFGVLTVETLDQAMQRSEKGAEAAQAAFFMYVNKCVQNWV